MRCAPVFIGTVPRLRNNPTLYTMHATPTPHYNAPSLFSPCLFRSARSLLPVRNHSFPSFAPLPRRSNFLKKAELELMTAYIAGTEAAKKNFLDLHGSTVSYWGASH